MVWSYVFHHNWSIQNVPMGIPMTSNDPSGWFTTHLHLSSLVTRRTCCKCGTSRLLRPPWCHTGPSSSSSAGLILCKRHEMIWKIRMGPTTMRVELAICCSSLFKFPNGIQRKIEETFLLSFQLAGLELIFSRPSEGAWSKSIKKWLDDVWCTMAHFRHFILLHLSGCEHFVSQFCGLTKLHEQRSLSDWFIRLLAMVCH